MCSNSSSYFSTIFNALRGHHYDHNHLHHHHHYEHEYGQRSRCVATNCAVAFCTSGSHRYSLHSYLFVGIIINIALMIMMMMILMMICNRTFLSSLHPGHLTKCSWMSFIRNYFVCQYHHYHHNHHYHHYHCHHRHHHHHQHHHHHHHHLETGEGGVSFLGEPRASTCCHVPEMVITMITVLIMIIMMMMILMIVMMTMTAKSKPVLPRTWEQLQSWLWLWLGTWLCW